MLESVRHDEGSEVRRPALGLVVAVLLVLLSPVVSLQHGIHLSLGGTSATAEENCPVTDPAWETLQAIDNTGQAPPGYVGGGTFANDGRDGGQVLPLEDANGNPISYREWDIYPYQEGVNRGSERIVTGSLSGNHDPNGSAFYTGDHYRTFTIMRAFA